jgi:hypothetical protein
MKQKMKQQKSPKLWLFKLKNIIYFGKISIFQKFFWVFKNGQKKCPKSKTKNTFWKKLVKNGL